MKFIRVGAWIAAADDERIVFLSDGSIAYPHEANGKARELQLVFDATGERVERKLGIGFRFQSTNYLQLADKVLNLDRCRIEPTPAFLASYPDYQPLEIIGAILREL